MAKFIDYYNSLKNYYRKFKYRRFKYYKRIRRGVEELKIVKVLKILSSLNDKTYRRKELIKIIISSVNAKPSYADKLVDQLVNYYGCLVRVEPGVYRIDKERVMKLIKELQGE